MRIHDSDHSIGSILSDCRVDTRGLDEPLQGVVEGIDLAKLNRRLSTMNVPEVRRKRRDMELFFQEIMVSADIERGINFTSCMMILAHYKIISDGKSLKLDEFLRRRARLQRVEEGVKRTVVQGFFKTWLEHRRFRLRHKFRDSARMMTIPQFAVPEIFVDDQNVVSPLDGGFFESPPVVPPKTGSTDIGSAENIEGLRRRNDSVAGSSARSGASSGNVSPQLSPHRPSHSGSFNWSYDGPSASNENPFASGGSPGGSPARSPGRSRAGSAVDEILAGSRSRAASSVEERERQDVLDVFDNSAWGESIRRSFTLRRNGTRGRGKESRQF